MFQMKYKYDRSFREAGITYQISQDTGLPSFRATENNVIIPFSCQIRLFMWRNVFLLSILAISFVWSAWYILHLHIEIQKKNKAQESYR